MRILTTDSINFTPTVSGGVGTLSYSWLDNGSEFATTLNATKLSWTAGDHNVTLAVTDDISTIAFSVDIKAYAPISITIDSPSEGENIYQYTSYNVEATASNGYGTRIFDWNLNSTNIASTEDFTYTFDTIGNYVLDVGVSDDLSSDSDSVNFNVIENWDANIYLPEYPTDENFLLPDTLYQGQYEVHDKSNPGDRKYYIDFAFNDTPSLDGTEFYIDLNREISVSTTDTNTILSYEVPSELAPDSLYALIKLYIYDSSDNLIETETVASFQFDVNYGYFKVNTYDENSFTKLDDDVYILAEDGETRYYADENGEFYFNPYERGWNRVMDWTIHKEGYQTRDFVVFMNPYQIVDFNFVMLPEGLSDDIEFLVKDRKENVWSNKYLRFIQQNGATVTVNRNILHEPLKYTSTKNESNKSGVLIKANKDLYVNSIKFKQLEGAPIESFYLYDYNTSTILYRDFTGLSDSEIQIPGGFPLDENKYYAFVFDSNGDNYTKYYKNNTFLSGAVEYDSVDFVKGCKEAFDICENKNAYILTSINTIDKNEFDVLSSAPYIEFLKVNNEGKTNLHGLQDGNYIAQLIDETGVLTDIYYKSTVELKKPIDEKSGNLISPYDVDVGGLLNYSIDNVSDANTNFNIFAGTTGYYKFSVVDYNANPDLREYFPKSYITSIEMGGNYVSSYELQPYLLTINSGTGASIVATDEIGFSVEGAVILVYKTIGAKRELIASGQTDATGRFNFTAYPLDDYYIYVYYNNELKLSDKRINMYPDYEFGVTFDTGTDDEETIYQNSRISYSDIIKNYNLLKTTDSLQIEGGIKSTSYMDVPSIIIYELYYDDVLVDTNSFSPTSKTTSYSPKFDISEFAFSKFKPYYFNIKTTVYMGTNIEITRSENIRLNIVEKLGADNRDIFSAMQDAANELGQPWAIIIAVLFTGFLLLFLVYMGFPTTQPVPLAVAGIIILGVFAMLGWLNVGVVAPSTSWGVDIGQLGYALLVIGLIINSLRGGI
jgi:hypothetical protein